VSVGGDLAVSVRAVLFVSLAALLISCGDREPGETSLPQGGKVNVITTLFPLYDFARTIGQDRVEVSLLLPPGVEAHSFEPKPSDIVKVSAADLFIYTGKFMEPWVETVLTGVINPKLKVVDASVGIPLLTAESEAHEHEAGHEQGETAATGETGKDGRHRLGRTDVDPHIWLDLGNAAKMVDTIAAGLVEVDPAHKALFAKNAEEYKKELAALDARFRNELSRCAKREFIQGGHFTFGYLARRYNLTYIAALGFTPDSQPSPRQLMALSKQIKEHGLKYIYYEELMQPRVAETLARETGAALLMLHGAHNVSKEELGRGVTFLAIMEQNLANLKVGLQCTQ